MFVTNNPNLYKECTGMADSINALPLTFVDQTKKLELIRMRNALKRCRPELYKSQLSMVDFDRAIEHASKIIGIAA